MQTSMRDASAVPSKQISFRIPLELWERAEQLAEQLNELPEYQGHSVSPSRVLVMAMHTGIGPIEDRHRPKKGRKR